MTPVITKPNEQVYIEPKTIELSRKIAVLERERKDALELLGKFFVVKHKDVADECELETIIKVEKLSEEIELCKNEINWINGYIVCPDCKTKMSRDSNFCDNCGKRIVSPVRETVKLSMDGICDKCGNRIEPHQKFCRNCGNDLTSKRMQEKRCRNCGQVLRKDMLFCVKCGTKY